MSEINQVRVYEKFIECVLDSHHTNSTAIEKIGLEFNHALFVLELRNLVDPEIYYNHLITRLFRQLSKKNKTLKQSSNNYQGGRILWHKTLLERCSKPGAENAYVSGIKTCDFNNLENQLVVFLFRILLETLRNLPPFLRSGYLFAPQNFQRVKRAGPRISALERIFETSLKHPNIVQIRTPSSITEEHLTACMASRVFDYHTVAELFREYSALDSRAKHVCPSIILLPGELSEASIDWIRAMAYFVQKSSVGSDLTPKS